MASPALERLEKLIGTPRDGALLRYSIGIEYQKEGALDRAVEQLREAVARDSLYSAAWKALGKALADTGRRAEAIDAYRRGIEAAGRKGDRQAEKEMRVFLKRLEKQSGGSSPG
jgi:predicted Zn-dependent protease